MEQANQTLEQYLRSFTTFHQDDWADWTPLAEYTLNNQDLAAIGISPFFVEHGYHGTIGINLADEELGPQWNIKLRAQERTDRIRKVTEHLRQHMESAQARYEEQTNRSREPAPQLSVGDKVWLDLWNIKTKRPCKKLDAKNGLFTMKQVVSSHAYKLDTPPGIHNMFHVKLLRPASTDPLPSQVVDETQPPAIVGEDEEEEWQIDEILDSKETRRGCYRTVKRQYLVKWTGYAQATWEPEEFVEKTAAMA